MCSTSEDLLSLIVCVHKLLYELIYRDDSFTVHVHYMHSKESAKLGLHHIDKNHFCIGGQNSGKMRGRTSLIKSIYLALEKGPFYILELPH